MEHTSKPPPADPRYAFFGEAMWKYITNQSGAFCGEEISEDILPLAQAAGLCRRVEYNPELHGDNIEAAPGSEIWYWGDADSQQPNLDLVFSNESSPSTPPP